MIYICEERVLYYCYYYYCCCYYYLQLIFLGCFAQPSYFHRRRAVVQSPLS